jgi:hypothetical protein
MTRRRTICISFCRNGSSCSSRHAAATATCLLRARASFRQASPDASSRSPGRPVTPRPPPRQPLAALPRSISRRG